VADGSDIVADGLVLPPRELVPKPDDDDPLDYYYRPLTARIYRARLTLAMDLLEPRRYDALVEVGYGSGILLPELARRANRLAAIDQHPESGRVREMLGRLGVEADLREGTLFEMPFEDGQFDALVCLSVLEHLTQLEDALTEFRRVLRRGGVAVLGFPARNIVTDSFFRAVGYNPRAIHPSGHRDVLAAVRAHQGFALERAARFPRLLPLDLSGYVGCRCTAA
jgi:2-polyprenyl-3-methyl-5-hydroxy-6-metoxy-1,4-benzoquinol methylase